MIVYLIGMMGSGKTTLGQYIADRLNYHWVDLDQLIEQLTKLSIHQYIQIYGVDHFRQIESDTLRQLNVSPLIVSCGGGIILREENITFMREHGIVIYLNCHVQTLEERLRKTDLQTRPLLQGNLFERLTTIESERKDLYEAASHYEVICDGKSIAELGEELIDIIKRV